MEVVGAEVDVLDDVIDIVADPVVVTDVVEAGVVLLVDEEAIFNTE